ncbi:hypothetical protein A3B21_03645 [Candidatus Uhrbacteria bacterium RIFCSPLOWO2_01_FULL_47_24]|uniref:Cell shape-determining protein MreC n=1 Tax=Candidatus Uhrbacteria bacterium RIFCSPLOWO2_01_FULL_47_24 TaxID=1802401 RepID=A0A1F7UU83_9BACT|nr:MAG: hypothetical protein A3D58_03015 [Candidatus Uhrbacteria bacterium RIFCSPHIGHO2_02_FULL_46_47]OGL75287.1 MAG: hypothetical protein A3F52_04445 [Candidatus Uhrbacteria bacterium RIFCSPHIGHO2_12_FULL_47_11]OGL81284.1 MAG: hypothetical protein A3B21_03645 [Candidatus Uhrbacteria bacterium RIFCSPLOWO2_01_FULL_47_24]OGL85171.1 MAG: hypothetical protein A3J03_01860 [Candidatus Uhrbacteria bacterium RIFCSPLOWO2_02_FULL_46_25]OGL92856.1 MAG: hypothetical protein A3H11_03530 [Candidatus Uhrbacte
MKRTVRASIALILALIFLIVLTGNFITGRVFGVFGTLTRPLTSVAYRLGSTFQHAFALPFRASKLEKENELLRAKNVGLVREDINLHELQRENAALRAELNFFENEKYPLAVARIIGRTQEGGNTFLILNRGKNAGIEIGAPVIANGIIIGKIIKSDSAISIAAPLTTSGMKTAATFAGSEKTAGIIEGELNASLVLRLIPKDISVQNGMRVITSGLEAQIPRGLWIGTIERVVTNQEDLFQTAYLNAPLRLEDIAIVSIIKSIKLPPSS